MDKVPLISAHSSDPTSAELSLLNKLFNTGRYAELENLARTIIRTKPNAGVAWKLLALSLRMQGKKSLPEMQKAAELLPDDAEAHNNLANILRESGQLNAASESYRHALIINPSFVGALNNLANLLLSQGEPVAALDIIVRSMQIEERGARSIFVDCIRRLSFAHVSDFVRNAVVRALSETWGRPAELMSVGIEIVKLNPKIGACIQQANEAWGQQFPDEDLFKLSDLDAVADDSLLIALLDAAPICDIGLERFLTVARRVMLNHATAMTVTGDSDDAFLLFQSALARQCFITEYVFAYGDEEITQVRALLNLVSKALETESPIPTVCLLAVASYLPLCLIPLADRLFERKWSDALTGVLVQQVREPKEEQQLRSTIPRLTPIEDNVSLLVQSQYEENPYPRWVKAAPAKQPVTLDEAIFRSFSLSPFHPLGKNDGVDILIAGCGTGQHSISTALNYRGAKVLAVDLSLTSLSYAKRKTKELGLSVIEYAQADILCLESLGRSFDLIESSGVLHHLEAPLTGWKVLVSLLRPGGIMKLGFYSEIARRDIVRAQNFITQHGYTASPDDIRRCRQELMNHDFESILGLADFFSISTCRDLLFHVQEHRMSLLDIASFIQKNNLEFLGFEIDAKVRNSYRLRFPEDISETNLSNWQIFEHENPDTFIGMYRICIQKGS